MKNKIFLIAINLICVALYITGFIFIYYGWYFIIVATILVVIQLIYSMLNIKKYEFNSLTNDKNNEELLSFVSNKFYRILINSEKKIYYLSQRTRKDLDLQVFDSIIDYLPERILNTEYKEIKVEIKGNLYMYYRVMNTIYLWPINEMEKYRKLYSESVNGVGYLVLDNYREVTNNLSEAQKYEYLSKFYQICEETFDKYNIIAKRISSTRYFFVATIGSYRKLKNDGFNVLKKINSIYAKEEESLTASIGFSINQSDSDTVTISQNANNALNLALERGGNQVIEIINDEMKIIGGTTHTNTIRTKVRVRMFSKNLIKKIEEAKDIVLFGHYNIDMDCFASLITMYEIIKLIDPKKDVKICCKIASSSYDVNNAYNLLDSKITSNFTTNLSVNSDTLAIVIDVSNLNNIFESKQFIKSQNIIVIDHHLRESNVKLENSISLVDVNASSTSELLVEILFYAQYIKKVSKNALNFLYTGIIIDTDNLLQKVSTNTFDALSTLVRNGANIKQSFELVQDSYDFIKEKNEVISQASAYKSTYVIATSNYLWTNTKIAKTANDLLKLRDFDCSFVISKTQEGIKISARSNGNVNVGNIMKKLKGGGHATIAATLLNTNLENAKNQLIQAINVYEGEV